MGTQTLSLNWSNQETNMIEEFQQLLLSESFLDVTLACEGLSLKAHKMVLSASSSLFEDLFLENPCQHPIVILIDVDYRDLKALVQFMYWGHIDIKQERLSKFLKTAEKLKIRGLSAVTDNSNCMVGDQEEHSTVPALDSVSEHSDVHSQGENSVLSSTEKRIEESHSAGDKQPNNNTHENSERVLNIKVENDYSAAEAGEFDPSSSNNYWSNDYFGQENASQGDWGSNAGRTAVPCTLPLPHREHPYAKRNGERGDMNDFQQDENGGDMLPTAYDGHPQAQLLAPPINSSIEDILESINDHLSTKYQSGETECVTPDIPPLGIGATSSNAFQNFRSISQGRVQASSVCKVCGKRFQQRWHLVRHEKIHTGEKPHSCVVCQKRFIQKGDLRMHLRIHSGEKPYTCNMCGKKCRTSSDLTVHRKVHTGERPHSCELCKKRFIQKSDLVRHLRAHRGEKPYSCGMCNRTFARTWNLKMHAAKAHPAENSNQLVQNCVKTHGAKAHTVDNSNQLVQTL